MPALKLAFRNVFAHAQRSLIMFIVIALVSCIVLLFMCFSDGQIDNFSKGLIALMSPSADVVVYARGLRTAEIEGEDWKRTSALSIRGYRPLLREIRAMSFVRRAYAPTTELNLSVFAGGQKYKNFIFRGVDPAAPWLIKEFIDMKEGSFFESSGEPEVILHYRTASTMNVRPGDRIILQGRDLFGQVVFQEAVLKGFFVPRQDMPYLINNGFMNMAAYDLVSGFSPGETMSLFVDLKKGESKSAAILALRDWAANRGLGLEAWDFDELPKTDLFDVVNLLRLVFVAASILIIAIMTFGIMSVVSVNLYDRKREIGTYYCLGSGKPFLVRLYALEILITNAAGAAAGLTVGLAVRWVLNSLAITTDVSGVQLLLGGSRLNIGFSPGSLAFLACSILVVSILTAVTTLGARLRVPPLAAMREVE
jgi:ABC-type lipoprotein release transport system permease subunit